MGYSTTSTCDLGRYERWSQRQKRRRLEKACADSDNELQVEGDQETPLIHAGTQASVEMADVSCQTEGSNAEEELELLKRKYEYLESRCETQGGAILTLQDNEKKLKFFTGLVTFNNFRPFK